MAENQMKYDSKIIDFWKTKGLDNIKPDTGEEFPEGWDVRDFLSVECEMANETVAEIGCGYGRLCEAFSPEKYTGYDINPNAIALAKKMHPDYSFEHCTIGNPVIESRYVLFYTVLLHVPDESLVDFLKVTTASATEIVIGEIMGRKWRRGGEPPVFNRELDEYLDIIEGAGFQTAHLTKDMPYERYKDTNISFVFSKRAR